MLLTFTTAPWAAKSSGRSSCGGIGARRERVRRQEWLEPLLRHGCARIAAGSAFWTRVSRLGEHGGRREVGGECLLKVGHRQLRQGTQALHGRVAHQQVHRRRRPSASDACQQGLQLLRRGSVGRRRPLVQLLDIALQGVRAAAARRRGAAVHADDGVSFSLGGRKAHSEILGLALPLLGPRTVSSVQTACPIPPAAPVTTATGMPAGRGGQPKGGGREASQVSGENPVLKPVSTS